MAALAAVVPAGCGGGDGDGGADASVAEDAAANDASYAAYNLFTGAPRFGVFKADAARDLCIRVVFLWGGTDGTADLADALTSDSITATNRAADCAPVNSGSPPSLEPPGVAAQQATGQVTVRRIPDGQADRWTVSLDGTLSFPSDPAWLPATEPLRAADLEIVGGCC